MLPHLCRAPDPSYPQDWELSSATTRPRSASPNAVATVVRLVFFTLQAGSAAGSSPSTQMSFHHDFQCAAMCNDVHEHAPGPRGGMAMASPPRPKSLGRPLVCEPSTIFRAWRLRVLRSTKAHPARQPTPLKGRDQMEQRRWSQHKTRNTSECFHEHHGPQFVHGSLGVCPDGAELILCGPYNS